MITIEVIESWKADGLHSNFVMRNDLLCCVSRKMYTWGVVVDLTESGCWGRFCFDTKANAILFLDGWDAYSYPVVGLDGCTAIKAGVRPLESPKFDLNVLFLASI